jgi:hypothetical protein
MRAMRIARVVKNGSMTIDFVERDRPSVAGRR